MGAEVGRVPNVIVVGVLGVALVLGCCVVDVDGWCRAVGDCCFGYGHVPKAYCSGCSG